MKYLSVMNKSTLGNVKRELSKLDLDLLDLSWLPERMETCYLQNLESVINSGFNEDRLQEYFNGYVSMREIFVKYNNGYAGYLGLGSGKKGVLDNNSFGGRLHSPERLHSPYSDKRCFKLKKLASNKGHNIKLRLD
jgi:hypothetical protein